MTITQSAQPIIAFDFDGVLINSIQEVMHCAHLAAGFGPTPNKEFTNNFLKNRYVVQQAGDFIPFANWCQNPAGSPEETINKETSSVPGRTKKFFRAREELLPLLGNKWFGIHSLYEQVVSFLKSLDSKQWIIVTHKDKAATVSLCEHLDIPVTEKQLFTGDSHNQKSKQLELSGYQNIFFVDDSIKNLTEVKNKRPETKLFLALWGYVGPEDSLNATQLGIASGSQENFVKASKEFLSSH